MYIGTFHSLCLHFLKEHLENTRLKKNFRLMDAFDQQYLVFQNLKRFKDEVFSSPSSWVRAGKICSYVNKLSEELISPEKLINDDDVSIAAIGKIFQTYNDLLAENNLLDFSSIMAETFRMLSENREVLEELRSKITHIMVDEYQDTNNIQEQIIFLLAGNRKNICVVGDDDQGLYRFRGATIRNILEFPKKFSECRIIPLVMNYRSNDGIINFYNRYMSRPLYFQWDGFRYEKIIQAAVPADIKSPTVVKISGFLSADNWHKKIFNFIQNLKNFGKLTDYNQIAFLFRSVKNERAVNLANFLESNGINVYSPRSSMFFMRYEICLALGCLMLMFPSYVKKLENNNFFLNDEQKEYFFTCVKITNLVLAENIELRSLIREIGLTHFHLTDTTDYAYSDLLYRLFSFQPFANFLDIDINAGVVDVRPVRNLAKLTQIIGKFENIHGIDTLNAKSMDANTERLFNNYIRLLFDGGITEFEDESEYAPSGCVSFMTIHQAKGMEFPIVFVDSLYSVPRSQKDVLMEKIENQYFNRPAFEPQAIIKFFDFWRLFYTAFSRAQDLLILTCREKNPSEYFESVYESLPTADEIEINEFEFKTVKDVNIKKTYSFTSNITVYETCQLQYKFYEYGLLLYDR